MILRVDHIGIALKSIDELLKLYSEGLGLKLKNIEVVEEQKARTAIFPVGETKIELVESTDPSGPIGRFIEKRGEGLHHIAFAVDNIEETVKELQAKGITFVDTTPRGGVEKTRIVFLHPKDTKVLLELVEKPGCGPDSP